MNRFLRQHPKVVSDHTLFGFTRGYCEIIAAKLARQNGFEYTGEESYLMWVQNTQKLIDFVSEKYFARAYFY